MKKKIMALLLAGAMVLGLAACGNGEPAPGPAGSAGGEAQNPGTTYTLRIGMPTGGKHFSPYTCEEFKTLVEAETNGQVVVEIYPGSQLGTNTQMLEGVQNGTIESVIVPASYYSAYAPATAVTDVPFLFDTPEQVCEVLNQDNPLNTYMAEYGFTVGCWIKNPVRYILSQDKYESVADLKNQKIWCLPSTTLQEELECYGAVPTALDPSDIAVSLQNGTVDGVETDVIFMNTQGLGESAKYLNLVPGTPMCTPWVFSTDWLETLPDDIRTTILECAMKVGTEKEPAYMDQIYEVNLNALQEAGAEVVEPSAALLDEMKAASQPVVDTFCKDADNAKMYEDIKALLGK